MPIEESLIRKLCLKVLEGSSVKKIAQNVIPIPENDMRFRRMWHFPEHAKFQNQLKRRKLGCKGKSRVRCIKCNIFLCLQNKNCFLNFCEK